MSPQSAGLESQATTNFDINWENQQLARQLSALSGMGGAYSGAAADTAQAANLGQMPLEALLAGISGAGSAYGGAGQAYGGATAAGMAPLQQLLAGLQGYTGASQAANQTGALAGTNLGAAQNFAAGAPGAYLAGGTIPTETAFTAYGLPGQAANAYTSGAAASNQPFASLMSSIIPYLNYGQGANQNAYGAFTGQQQFGANQQQMGMNALGQGLSQLSTAYNQPGSWLGNMFGGGGNYNPYAGMPSVGTGGGWGYGTFDQQTAY